MAVGRPKITLDEFGDEWEETVLALYSEGASDVEIRAELDISQSTFDRLLAEEDVFSITIKRGRSLSNAWWERKGRLNIENKDFNSRLWDINMQNRFDWRKKQDSEMTGKNGASLAFTLKIGEGGGGSDA